VVGEPERVTCVFVHMCMRLCMRLHCVRGERNDVDSLSLRLDGGRGTACGLDTNSIAEGVLYLSKMGSGKIR
jgi:hypothetical protein